MQAEARQIVATAAPGAAIDEHRHVEMRYVGQGHEIAVTLPLRDLTTDDAPFLRDAVREALRRASSAARCPESTSRSSPGRSP